MEDLEARKVYLILPDREAAREGYIRVVDESGDDYIYPSELFVPVRLPPAVVRRLRRPVRPKPGPLAVRFGEPGKQIRFERLRRPSFHPWLRANSNLNDQQRRGNTDTGAVFPRSCCSFRRSAPERDPK
jgi:hypothetical protein